jgi:hypothetical protein
MCRFINSSKIFSLLRLFLSTGYGAVTATHCCHCALHLQAH